MTVPIRCWKFSESPPSLQALSGDPSNAAVLFHIPSGTPIYEWIYQLGDYCDTYPHPTKQGDRVLISYKAPTDG